MMLRCASSPPTVYTQDMVLPFCAAAAMLYIGLLMLIDPDAFMTLLDQTASALRNFERALQRFPWREVPWQQIERTPRTRIVVRLMAVPIVLVAFLRLSGLV